MSFLTVDVEVTSAAVRGHPNPETAQIPLTSILEFFADGPEATEARAPKRRKLVNGSSVGSHATVPFDEGNSALFSRTTLDLHLLPSIIDQHGGSNFSGGDGKVIDVSLERFSRPCFGRNARPSLEIFSNPSPNTFRLRLYDTQEESRGIDLTATTSAGLLNTIQTRLEIAANLSPTASGKKRTGKSGAAFSRCRLQQTSNKERLILEVEIRWLLGFPVVETLANKSPAGKQNLQILANYFPDQHKESQEPWSLSDFYDSVHVPAADTDVPPQIRTDLLETSLYPFQQRAVDWLLRREGVTYTEPDGSLKSIGDDPTLTIPASFTSAQDATGRNIYVSYLQGLIVADLSQIPDSSRALKGGILAEEMGLGKTVELIALILHHKRQVPEGDVYDAYTGTLVKASGSTLIITPPSILEQWINEIHTHAPELTVYHYKGLPALNGSKAELAGATVENLLRFDIVLTTYTVLSREVHFAKPPPDRSRRREKQHQIRKSPLMELSWWRVCLDEAQMVESGVSQAATVARIIPRCNAWAVSGTPLRKDVQDLRGLLTFLRFEPFANSRAAWERLDKPTFRALFNQISLRHTKEKIRDELRLPPQKRVVITVPFTAIEEQNYSEMIRQMCDDCGLSSEGYPINLARGVDHPDTIERMREWLVRLRQTCLHAHVGTRNRKAMGAKNGPLRTVHEVLEVMIDQNDTLLKSEARENILAQIKSGHIKANAKDVENRSETALPFYQQALKEAQKYVEIFREELLIEKKKLGTAPLDATDATALASLEDDQGSDEDESQGEHVGRIPAIQKALRSFLELDHACRFFIGTVHFQLKSNETLTKPDSEEFHKLEKLEVEWYAGAKELRKELLRESQNRAQIQMKRISSKKPFCQIAPIVDLPDLGGIETRKVVDMMDNITDLLNAQAKQLQEWRQKIVDILLMPLVDEDEGKDTTGEEYEDSTKLQDELYVYILALRAITADRNAAVNGLKDTLLEYEMKDAETMALGKDIRKGRGHAPELLLKIVAARAKLIPTEKDGSLKGAVAAVRSILTSLQWRADGGDSRAKSELAIAQKQFAEIQKITSEQAKIIVDLEKEQEMFRSTMNQRLEFYRQLQHISDTVAPWREELDLTLDQREFEKQTRLKLQSEDQLSTLKTKHAYLVNLRRENREALNHECIICQDVFEIGVLTTCGHKYCKECIKKWWSSHRNCPLCKQRLKAFDFKVINFKPGEVRAQEETQDHGSISQPSTPESSSNGSIYSDISDSTMKEIRTIELKGSYGTKVDMITRHLLWIRNNDPGAKSIIFSQFGDFLDVLREALDKWKIGTSSINQKNGIRNFKNDPAIECFLLDAKSDSSGLNLVNATYVFLCEPLINPAIELQAIARVHRIGQQRATTVFMYLVNDTVEEAIYDISVARRLEHMSKGNKSKSSSATPLLQETNLDVANSLEMQAAPLKQLLRKKGDGEVVQADDLWGCLFRKPRKEPSVVLNQEVATHLRADAAEQRLAETVPQILTSTSDVSFSVAGPSGS
ncbi:ATP-dependent DNA helicase [Pleomassaria siparia CBS 279.74]|uniref:ATP-dependent DNA helicase n=1 Tax=Pleomassaria siparia CBS 279.74 TaxID=1314801 RepID=A0A6G1KC90_9PLEO|nr:ATP-dependent DNA helicase [Pleomassaria siparia CBS 279.74]